MTTLKLLAGERFKRESEKAVIACNDWLRIGPMRTLTLLHERYIETPADSAPTHSINTLGAWSKNFKWSARAEIFDAKWDEYKTEQRQKILGQGLALDYERVMRLMKIADFLEGQIFEVDKDGNYISVWVPDVKSIGSGEYAQRVDIERFNPAIFAELRAALADIAAEVGGRVKKSDITSNGESIILKTGMDIDEL